MRTQLTAFGAIALAAAQIAGAQLVAVDTAHPPAGASQFSSPGTLVARLRTAPRGEFETADKYAARLARALGSAPDSYLFRVSAGSSSCDGSISYDVDAERLNFALPSFVTDDVDAGVPVACVTDVVGTYTASNAMGTKISVTKGIRTITELVTETAEVFDSGSVALKPEAARALKPFARLAVLTSVGIGTDGQPFVFSETRSKPDFQTPYDITYRVSAIRAARIEAILYDSRTGKVVARARPVRLPAPAIADAGRTASTDAIPFMAVQEKPQFLRGDGGNGHLPMPPESPAAGFVDIEFVVLADGTVANAVIKTSTGTPYEEAGLRAVNGRIYYPGKRNGTPVAVVMRQIITFP